MGGEAVERDRLDHAVGGRTESGQQRGQWDCAKAHGLAIGNIVGNLDAGNIGPRQQRVPRKMTSLAADRDIEHRVC